MTFTLDKKRIGARIHDIREWRGIATGTFIGRVGCKMNVLESWELGKSLPRTCTLWRICHILAVPMKYMILGGVNDGGVIPEPPIENRDVRTIIAHNLSILMMNMSTKTLSEKIGVNMSTINRILNVRCEPSPLTILRLSLFFDKPIENFLAE